MKNKFTKAFWGVSMFTNVLIIEEFGKNVKLFG